MIRALVPALLALPCAAPAVASPLHGSWCSAEDGEMIHVDASGIGFNEHTVCDTNTPPDLSVGASWTGVLRCRNVYFTGAPGGADAMATHEIPLPDVSLTLTARDNDTLILHRPDGSEDRHTRCG